MELVITTVPAEGVTRVMVAGEVDVSNADELRGALDEVLGGASGPIEADISQVPYIDSTGIGVFVGAAHRAAEAGSSLSVVGPQRNVARVLGLLGLDDELGIRES